MNFISFLRAFAIHDIETQNTPYTEIFADIEFTFHSFSHKMKKLKMLFYS